MTRSPLVEASRIARRRGTLYAATCEGYQGQSPWLVGNFVIGNVFVIYFVLVAALANA
jgi:hypothetical protein